MKRSIITVAVVFVFSAHTAWASERTVTMDIQNMTCALCPITVSKAIRGVNGVKAVSVNLEGHSAKVTYEDTLAKEEVIALASSNAGYPATPRASQ